MRKLQFQVHRVLLAAISDMIKMALLDIAPKDLDEVVLIVPDTNKEELETFKNIVHGDYTEKQPFELNLFKILEINKPSFTNETLIETSNKIYEKTEPNWNGKPESFKTVDVKKLMLEEPERLSFKDLDETSNSKLLENYCQVLIDYQDVPFVKCKHCPAIFMQTSSTSNTVMKRHCVQHKSKKEEKNEKKLGLTEVREILKKDPERIRERESEGNSDVWKSFQMLTVDDIPVPFAKCLDCEAVLIHSSKSGTSTLRKHIQTHVNEQRGKYVHS